MKPFILLVASLIPPRHHGMSHRVNLALGQEGTGRISQTQPTWVPFIETRGQSFENPQTFETAIMVRTLHEINARVLAK